MKVRKAILHGSFMTENFGDMLLLQIFSARIRSLAPDVDCLLSGGSDRNAQSVGLRRARFYHRWLSRIPIIFAGGGYLGEPAMGAARWRLRLWKRHLGWMAYLAATRRKYGIFATGFGPIGCATTRSALVRAVNGAVSVSLRDRESVEYAISYGADPTKIDLVADAVLSCDSFDLMAFAASGHCSPHKGGRGAVAVVHVPGGGHEGELRRWICNTTEEALGNTFDIVYLSDSNLGVSPDFFSWRSKEAKEAPFRSVGEVLSLLGSADLVITTKLHVGICACILGKTVISTNAHPKTRRFYAQINRPELCIGMSSAAEWKKRYRELLSGVMDGSIRPVEVPREVAGQARRIWGRLECFLEAQQC